MERYISGIKCFLETEKLKKNFVMFTKVNSINENCIYMNNFAIKTYCLMFILYELF